MATQRSKKKKAKKKVEDDRPPEPLKTDPAGPDFLTLNIDDEHGIPWTPAGLSMYAKNFKTGSVGYSATGFMKNPASGETYNYSINFVLKGSKPI